jgi:hypothetical protein
MPRLLLLAGLVAAANAAPVVLTDANFEHDTQAATGATTGPWFVKVRHGQSRRVQGRAQGRTIGVCDSALAEHSIITIAGILERSCVERGEAPCVVGRTCVLHGRSNHLAPLV